MIQDEKIEKDSLAVEPELQVMSFTQNFKQCTSKLTTILKIALADAPVRRLITLIDKPTSYQI